MSMQVNPLSFLFLQKVLRMMVMALHVLEYSTISTNSKQEEQVLLDMKSWVSIKMENKSFLKDSTKIKTNIGKKSFKKVIKLSQSLIFAVTKNILRQP